MPADTRKRTEADTNPDAPHGRAWLFGSMDVLPVTSARESARERSPPESGTPVARSYAVVVQGSAGDQALSANTR